MNSKIKGFVESLAFGGNGIVRHEGLVIFVPFTAPGDEILFRITKQKKAYALGEIVQILNPSTDRIKPLCPYFGICGGCQLQHMSYEAQLESKRKWVEESLKRIGKLPPIKIIAIPSKPWAYRRHIHLNLRPKLNGFEAGYIATDNQSLVKVDVCPIFIPLEDPALKQLQALIQDLDNSNGQEGRVSIFKRSQGYLFHFSINQKPSNAEKIFEKALVDGICSGIILSTTQEILQFGDTSCMMDIEGLTIQFTPMAFVQNNPEQSLNIYRHVAQIAKNCNSARVLDLYCGIGGTSLLIAKQTEKVFGIENNVSAVQLANQNAKHNAIRNAEFLCADVQKSLEKKWDEINPDFVLMNPPRIGMDPAVIKCLLKKLPRNMVYISCNPATLARDLHDLCAKEYTLDSCQVFDMFPQTAHVETVVMISRRGAKSPASLS